VVVSIGTVAPFTPLYVVSAGGPRLQVLLFLFSLCYIRTLEPFGWNYKPAEKHRWLIFCERKILFRLKKQAE
jgi:hypothetical protein